MMLAIRVEYLTGLCVATRHDDPSRATPEWPPHPDRLFSAMVAAAANIGAPTEGLPLAARSALQWLLDQGAPSLCVSAASRRVAPDVHVPANPHPDEIPTSGFDSGDQKTRRKKARTLLGLLPVHRKKAALAFPAVVPAEPSVFFIWPRTDPASHVNTLRDICAQMTYLGRSRSLVHATVVDDPPPPTHAPGEPGQFFLRVPGSDRLNYLIRKHELDGGKPSPCAPHPYHRTDTQRDVGPGSESVFDRCWVFRFRRGDAPLPATSTLKVTRALRGALIAAIDEDRRDLGLEPGVPEIVHGHGKHPHCAYLTLPFVHHQQRHADGAIKGMAVLTPREVDFESLSALAAGLRRVEKDGLGVPGMGMWHLEEVATDDPPNATLDPATWTGVARIWATATPMVFGHFPKPNKGGEAKVVLESLEMVGIDPHLAVEIAVDRHSPLHGTSPSWHFKPRVDAGEDKARPWVRHVTLRFDRPVRGPIVLGRLRHFGMGLMRPIEE